MPWVHRTSCCNLSSDITFVPHRVGRRAKSPNPNGTWIMNDAQDPWTAQFAALAGILGGMCAVLLLKKLATEEEVDGIFKAIEDLAIREFDADLVRAAIDRVRSSTHEFVRFDTLRH